MVYQTAFRRNSKDGPVGPTLNHQQGWWLVIYKLQKKLYKLHLSCYISLTKRKNID